MTMAPPPDAIQEKLVDDSLPPSAPGPVQQVVTAIKNLIIPTHKELITQLKVPTPIKIKKSFIVPASGTIGGGTATPDYSQIIYTAPMSSEAWIHRIHITSPQHGPGAPLSNGGIILYGTTAGEVMLFAPDSPSANTVPVDHLEGRYSAPHLDRGESITFSGGGLTANDVIIFDLQIVLVQGVTEFTPRVTSPTDLTKSNAADMA